MINRQKLAHLTSLINTSKILTDTEKSDWLSLLELMNDKQLGELEDILVNTKPVAGNSQAVGLPQSSGTTATSAATPPATPKLSHISNLPAGLTEKMQSAQQAVKPAQLDNEDFNTPSKLRSAFVQSGQRLSGSQMPAGLTNPQSNNNTVAAEQSPSQINKESISTSQQTESVRSKITEDSQAQVSLTQPDGHNQGAGIRSNLSSSVPPNSQNTALTQKQANDRELAAATVPKTQADIKDLEDVSDLTYITFRSYYFESLLRAVQDLVMRLGYFAVIVALENSPAYRTYLNTGKMLLGDTTQNPQEMFTKFEFEQFTDLLLNMRINVN